MISNAKEFKRLRESEVQTEYNRAVTEEASLDTWLEVLNIYPDLAFWVAQNKTVPLEILINLADNKDPKVRDMVARKKKINPTIFNKLKNDSEESIRYTLICNNKLTNEQKMQIKTDDSQWLREKIKETMENNT